MSAPELPSGPTAADLSDAEIDRLGDALLDAPEPLEPLGLVALDGFLCGVLVQPVWIPAEQWLPWVLDHSGRPPEEAGAAAWRASVEPLLLRRHAVLNRTLAEEGWFDPIVFGFDEDHPIAVSEYEALATLPPVSQALAPWVGGFMLALARFPQLRALTDEEVERGLAVLLRHLPPDPPPVEPPRFDAADPLAGLDAAIDELVAVVASIYERTVDDRYRVETLRREQPKVGRNDPCPCGSGRKFKRCHGAG